MRILYVVPFVPWEIKVRSFNLIPRLARTHEIDLVCLSNTRPTANQEVWLRKYCRQIVHVSQKRIASLAHCLSALPTSMPLRIAYCRSGAAQQTIRQMYTKLCPDLVYVERWRALGIVPSDVKCPILCDPTDSMTLYNERLMKTGSSWEKVVGWMEYRKFLRYEGELARRANATVFCSQVDLEYVRKQAPELRYELIPNGVDCEKYFYKDPSEEVQETVVFTGSFKYLPNRLAVKFFLTKILPLIKLKVPNIKFLIVGNGARTELSRWRGTPGVEVIDFVSDLRPYLAKASVAVAPLTVASGVSNKIAEGFAVGTPVVATPLACGDLPVNSGKELLIGRNAREFAAHTIELLKNQRLGRLLAAHARRFVEEQYDWEKVGSRMETLMVDIARIGRSAEREEQILSMGK